MTKEVSLKNNTNNINFVFDLAGASPRTGAAQALVSGSRQQQPRRRGGAAWGGRGAAGSGSHHPDPGTAPVASVAEPRGRGQRQRQSARRLGHHLRGPEFEFARRQNLARAAPPAPCTPKTLGRAQGRKVTSIHSPFIFLFSYYLQLHNWRNKWILFQILIMSLPTIWIRKKLKLGTYI